MVDSKSTAFYSAIFLATSFAGMSEMMAEGEAIGYATRAGRAPSSPTPAPLLTTLCLTAPPPLRRRLSGPCVVIAAAARARPRSAGRRGKCRPCGGERGAGADPPEVSAAYIFVHVTGKTVHLLELIADRASGPVGALAGMGEIIAERGRGDRRAAPPPTNNRSNLPNYKHVPLTSALPRICTAVSARALTLHCD